MRKICFLLSTVLVVGIFFTGCSKQNVTPPAIVVDAGPLQTITLPADTITLVGEVKSGQSQVASYSWSLISGPNVPTIANVNSITTNVSGLISGTYIFQFKAQNSNGTNVGIDTTSIVVSPAATISVSKLQLLTQHAWEFESTIVQINNTQTQYQRNGINTTGYDYDVAWFKYNADGTGVLYDTNNGYTNFTWSFTSNDSTKITGVFNYVSRSSPLTIYFTTVSLTDSTFTYTENYTDGGTPVLSSSKLIPLSSNSKLQLLTQQTWEFESTSVLINNNQTEYQRNGINTTGYNYDSAWFKFNIDGTGVLYDTNNGDVSFTWSFTANDSTKLTGVFNYPNRTSPLTIYYTNIVLTDSTFSYSENYVDGGTPVSGSSVLIPQP